ncbi:hypothetical protein QEN19_003426 [Hanseniaspora menglaensis]
MLKSSSLEPFFNLVNKTDTVDNKSNSIDQKKFDNKTENNQTKGFNCSEDFKCLRQKYNNQYHQLEFLTNYVSCNLTLKDTNPDMYSKNQVKSLKRYYFNKPTNAIKQPVKDHRGESFFSFKGTSEEEQESYCSQCMDTGNIKVTSFSNNGFCSYHSFHNTDWGPSETFVYENNHESYLKQLPLAPNFSSRSLISNINTPFLNRNKNLSLLKCLDNNQTELLKQEKKFYSSYLKRGNIVGSMDIEIEKTNLNVWIPVSFFSNELYQRLNNINFDDFNNNKITDVPEKRGEFDGAGFTQKLYGKHKIPALTYHTAVESKDNNVYVLGGMHPYCDSFTSASALKDFYCSKMNNLPEPLSYNILENPNMVYNKFIYKIDTSLNTVIRYTPQGDVPPPLICAKVSRLNKRLLFYFGGLELITEAVVDETDDQQVFLKRKTVMNKKCYVLNVDNNVFTKIKLDVENITSKNIDSRNLEMLTRFGHSQCVLTYQFLKEFEQGYHPFLIRKENRKLYFENEKLNSNVESKIFSNDNLAFNYPISSKNQPVTFSGSESIESSQKEDRDKKFSKTNFNESNDVFNILIFGGYNLNSEGKFETMNDMWKIKLSLTSRFDSHVFEPAAKAICFYVEEEETQTPSPRAYHSTTLLEPEMIEKKTYQNFADATEQLSCLIDDLANQNEMEKFIHNKPLKNLERMNKLNTYGLSHYSDQDPVLNKVSNIKKNKGNKPASLIIHGGYDRNGNMLSDFWVFSFKTFEWTKKALMAPTENSQKGFAKNSRHVKPKKEIHLRLAAHNFITKGKFLISLGGVIDENTNDFRWETKGDGLMTMIYLPDMEAVDVTAIENGALEKINSVFSGQHEVVKCKNGFFYVIGGISRIYFDRSMIEKSGTKDVLLNDPNTALTKCSYIKTILNGTVITFMPPTFTYLD